MKEIKKLVPLTLNDVVTIDIALNYFSSRIKAGKECLSEKDPDYDETLKTMNGFQEKINSLLLTLEPFMLDEETQK